MEYNNFLNQPNHDSKEVMSSVSTWFGYVLK